MQAMLQDTRSEKSDSRAQTTGKCDGKVTTNNPNESEHEGISKRTPNESYPNTIYCRACKADKPLTDYTFKSNGKLRSLLCTEHHNELKAAKLSENYKRIAELENIEYACENCGGLVIYHNWGMKYNGYKKMARCTSCRAIKVSKNIPLDFMSWANVEPVKTIPQKTIAQVKVSEYDKNIERTDSNKAFFLHLCSGNNYFEN